MQSLNVSPAVQQLPYIAPRKVRSYEPSRFVVKWIRDDTMYFRWFKRDTAACAFLNKLLDMGFEARVLMN
jgi:hypothetical protein